MPVSAYIWALFFHLVGVAMLAGGLSVAAVAQAAARRRKDPREIALLLGAGRLGVALVAAGTVLVLVFGSWLVELAGWSFAEGWILVSAGLFVAALVLGALGGRRPKRARERAERLARERRESDDELRRLLDDRASLVLNYGAAALLVVVLFLMIWKP